MAANGAINRLQARSRSPSSPHAAATRAQRVPTPSSPAPATAQSTASKHGSPTRAFGSMAMRPRPGPPSSTLPRCRSPWSSTVAVFASSSRSHRWTALSHVATSIRAPIAGSDRRLPTRVNLLAPPAQHARRRRRGGDPCRAASSFDHCSGSEAAGMFSDVSRARSPPASSRPLPRRRPARRAPGPRRRTTPACGPVRPGGPDPDRSSAPRACRRASGTAR